ncbi:hypothetical protein WME95_12995 [Sorangium sp. So ce327]|jgi:hypothetical protein|uniref:STAS domain-containing protein n=1 Tax=Sorangium cellulosum (strain So ce56) TaxID=448385 RepID=A9G177_SORC5|nr:hypothetical protein [Sorangium cellulosum]CAN92481.1 hypothetical protein predicted by Glimmer/Critica [Sorangium cellulosum So ce56]
MDSLRVDRITTDSFGIEPALLGDRLSIKLTGTGDMAAAAPLGAYCKEVQHEVRRLSLAAVEFDIRALYFLNSSCLKAFIAFISGVTGQGPSCKIRFVTDARLGWQRRSLAALERMSPGLVSIHDK